VREEGSVNEKGGGLPSSQANQNHHPSSNTASFHQITGGVRVGAGDALCRHLRADGRHGGVDRALGGAAGPGMQGAAGGLGLVLRLYRL